MTPVLIAMASAARLISSFAQAGNGSLVASVASITLAGLAVMSLGFVAVVANYWAKTTSQSGGMGIAIGGTTAASVLLIPMIFLRFDPAVVGFAGPIILPVVTTFGAVIGLITSHVRSK